MRDVTNNVSIISNPPNPFTQSFEFEVCEEFDNASELHMSISNDVEHHDSNESEDIFV